MNLYLITYYDPFTYEKMPAQMPQFVTAEDHELIDIMEHIESYTGLTVTLTPNEGQLFIEPQSKVWVDRLDRHVVVYEEYIEQ